MSVRSSQTKYAEREPQNNTHITSQLQTKVMLHISVLTRHAQRWHIHSTKGLFCRNIWVNEFCFNQHVSCGIGVQGSHFKPCRCCISDICMYWRYSLVSLSKRTANSRLSTIYIMSDSLFKTKNKAHIRTRNFPWPLFPSVRVGLVKQGNAGPGVISST
jgi:hypothetical protein